MKIVRIDVIGTDIKEKVDISIPKTIEEVHSVEMSTLDSIRSLILLSPENKIKICFGNDLPEWQILLSAINMEEIEEKIKAMLYVAMRTFDPIGRDDGFILRSVEQ